MICVFNELDLVSYDVYSFISRENAKKCSGSYRPYIRYSDRLKHEIAIYIIQLMCTQTGYNKYLSTFSYDGKGAPVLYGRFISISYSHETVVVAIDELNIGVDVEYFSSCSKEIQDGLRFQEERISEAEERSIFELNAKEAMGKYLHIGLEEGVMQSDFSEYFGQKSFTAYGMLFQYFKYDKYSIVSCCSNWQELIQISYCELKNTCKNISLP